MVPAGCRTVKHLHRLVTARAMSSIGRPEGKAREVAIIGGGLAGSYCAHLLGKSGIDVTLYDMGRSGVGGRSSTRRTSGLQFDHGCAFIMPTQEATKKLMLELQSAGVAQPWGAEVRSLRLDSTNTSQSSWETNGTRNFCGVHGGGVLPWVGQPGMNAICQHFAATAGVTRRLNCKVTNAVRSSEGRWKLGSSQRDNETNDDREWEQEVDLLILGDLMTALPGLPGSVEFGEAFSLTLLEKLRQPGKIPVFSLMLVLEGALPNRRVDAATISNSEVLQWIALDTSKPGRNRDDGKECWVAVSTTNFAHDFMEAGMKDPQEAVLQLQEEALRVLDAFSGGNSLPAVVSARVQKWGAAFKTGLLEEGSLLEVENGIGACGDFCRNSSAEGALASASHLAERILQDVPS